MRRALFLGLSLVFLLAGCGYHRPGKGDALAGVETLYIEFFTNRSYEPFLESEITNAVTERFLRTRNWRLVEDIKAADAVFSGSVSRYENSPVSFDSGDRVRSYRAELSVTATLKSTADGRVLWKGSQTLRKDYSTSTDKAVQEVSESQAIRALCKEIADDFLARATLSF